MEGWDFRLEEGAWADTLVATGAAGQAASVRLFRANSELALPPHGTLLAVKRIDERGCAVLREGGQVVWSSDLLLAKRRVLSLTAAFVLSAAALLVATPIVVLTLVSRMGHPGWAAAVMALVVAVSAVFLLIVRERSGLTLQLSSASNEVVLRAKPWHMHCTRFSLRDDVRAVYTFPTPGDPLTTTLAVLVGRPDLMAVLLPLRDGESGLAAINWHLLRGRGAVATLSTHEQHLATCRALAEHRNRELRGVGPEEPQQQQSDFVKSEEDELAIAVAQIADLESGAAEEEVQQLPDVTESEAGDDVPLLAHEV
jgi:hypothetical protein